jgi:hypothetical protein
MFLLLLWDTCIHVSENCTAELLLRRHLFRRTVCFAYHTTNDFPLEIITVIFENRVFTRMGGRPLSALILLFVPPGKCNLWHRQQLLMFHCVQLCVYVQLICSSGGCTRPYFIQIYASRQISTWWGGRSAQTRILIRLHSESSLLRPY